MSKSQKCVILTKYTLDLGTLNEITLTINLTLTHKIIIRIMKNIYKLEQKVLRRLMDLMHPSTSNHCGASIHVSPIHIGWKDFPK
jgi:hypothetical protein